MEAKLEAKTDMPAVEKKEGTTLFSLLYDPVSTIRYATHEMPVIHPLAAICAVSFVQILACLVMRTPSAGFSIVALTAGFFLHLAGKVTALLFGSIIIHFFASSFNAAGAAGKGWRLFSLFLVSQLPFIFILPVSLITKAIPGAGWVIYYFLVVLLAFWSFLLMILSIRENYKVSTAWSALIFIIPGFLVSIGSMILLSSMTFRMLFWIAPF